MKMKELTIIYEEDDKELLHMRLEELSNGPCDICGDAEVEYIVRGNDGNIYGVCQNCFEKLGL